MPSDLFTVVMVPPEGEPQTFTDTDAAGEKIERPLHRSITLSAKSEKSAQLRAEQQAFAIATAEHQKYVEEKFADKVGKDGLSEEDQVKQAEARSDIDAIQNRTWRVDSITAES